MAQKDNSIEVLEQGQAHIIKSNELTRCKCGTCHSVLNIKTSQWQSESHYNYNKPDVLYARCPVCQNRVYSIKNRDWTVGAYIWHLITVFCETCPFWAFIVSFVLCTMFIRFMIWTAHHIF